MARNAEVDPISTGAQFLYNIATAVMLGILGINIKILTDFLPTFTEIAPFVALVGAGIAVLYNGADLGSLSKGELVFVFIAIVGVAGRQFVPAIEQVMSDFSPLAPLVAWIMGAFALLLLAYGDGVSWYPFGG